ncbi:MAG: glycosyltransferase family 2 protein [Dehalococcoidia bacterium]|nr:MAG: glycosyltransferase family 2 protein [Dehalococcoidia bacterium]
MKKEGRTLQKPEHKFKIIAAIPCLNEERFIGSVILKTKKFVDSVIVIDDGSTDATAEVAAAAGAKVHKHGENRGYGAAISSALAKGRQLKTDVLVILDGDGQHDPNDIPNMIRPLLDGEADVVVGSRFLGTVKKPPLYRRLGQRVLTTVTNLSSGQKISDSQSGFRAYSSKALKELDLTETGMSASSELQFLIGRSGLRLAEVPIDVSYMGRVKRSPIGHGIAVLTRLLVLISLRQPLLLFGLPGLILMAAGLAFGIRVLALYSETRDLAVGNALGMILLFLAGLLALFSALMLQAMKEIMRGGAAQLAREMKEYANSGETIEGETSESKQSSPRPD